MTATEVAVTDDVMDFSLARRSIKFRLDDEEYEAAPDIATERALRFADQIERLESETATADEQIEVIRSLFRLFLFPESAERFIARLDDTTRPVGPQRFMRVIEWLFEEYGLRPTESDSASSAGPDDPASGTSSTESISVAAST